MATNIVGTISRMDRIVLVGISYFSHRWKEVNTLILKREIVLLTDTTEIDFADARDNYREIPDLVWKIRRDNKHILHYSL